MNITKKVKIKPEKPIQSKPSFLIISTNFQVETLYHIIIKNPHLVNTKDQKGETFLSYAIKRRNIENAELILTSPLLDYKYQDKNGNSYLHLAVINRLENIAKILIEKGIDINLQNNEGNTALHFAYNTGDMNLIRLIIESKADFTIKNNNGLIGEEIKEGTFPEILDVSNNNLNKNIINDISISDNKDNNKNNPKELDLNPDYEIKDYSNPNNEIIMNEKCQVNKSIKMDWDNNEINGNSKLTNNNNSNIVNTSNNINQSLSQQNSKIKFSLVNFSYSEDENNEETLKNKQKITEIKNCAQSSDIFDLASSATYQEKLANMNNSHTVGEPKIIQKKESSDSNTNDDIVNININKINNNQNKQQLLMDNNSININDIIQNGIQLSQMSFQTSYENGRKNMISNVSNSNNENGLPYKSEDNKKDKIFNENLNFGNGKINIYDFCKSLTKEEMNQNQFQYLKKDSEGISSNNDYNNINKSNTIQSKIEPNENFAFSPFASLKKPLNNQLNGSELNITNNNNSNNFNNFNINKEIKNIEKQNIKEYKTLSTSSPKINKYNVLKENNIEIKSQKSQTLEEINKKNKIYNRNNRNINKFNQNLSETNLNNFSTKNNTKINLDCPLNSTQDVFNSFHKSQDSLNKFLSEIRLEKYYSLMKSNGFDDVQLLINQTKTGIAIIDNQLKSAGINIPGDRAKILIRLQEKAGNFNFIVPKEVYYICQNIEDYGEDNNINKIKNWLEELKIDNYLDNFVKNGYHSLELMLLQMESKNPITEEILKDEIGIDKIGHRSRIINKLNEDAKVAYNKWKNSVLIIGDLTRKICDCNIF